MRFLYIFPKHGRKRDWVFAHAFASLNAYLRRSIDGIEVDFVDINMEGTAPVADYLRKNNYDFIALTGLTSHYKFVKEHVAGIRTILKGKNNRTPIIVGGAICTAQPQFMVERLGADYYVMGEGEEAYFDLIRTLAEGQDPGGIANVGFKDGDKIVVNPTRPVVEDLNSLPIPDYETFNFRHYAERSRTGEVTASRGCPFACGFCFRNLGPSYRVRTVESLFEEFDYLIKDHGINHIDFLDELFFASRKRMVQFSEGMIRRNYNLTWGTSLRTDLVDVELLKLMHRAGLMRVSYGIESGDDRVLKLMNKKTTAEVNRQALKDTLEAKIAPGCQLIIGYPGETVESIHNTERLLVESAASGGLHYCQALPGTPLYNQVRQAGFIKDEEDYVLSLADHIEDLPMDFTGLGKEYLARERERILKNTAPFARKNYQMMAEETFLFRSRHERFGWWKVLSYKVKSGANARLESINPRLAFYARTAFRAVRNLMRPRFLAGGWKVSTGQPGIGTGD